MDRYEHVPSRRESVPNPRELTRQEPAETGPARPIPISGVATSAPTTGDGGVSLEAAPSRTRRLSEVERIARPRDAGGWFDLLTRYASVVDGYRNVSFDGPIVTIGASHTGDMFDVTQAQRILHPAVVLIWGVSHGSLSKASEIARFINDRDNVFATEGGPPPDDWFTHGRELADLAARRSERRQVWIKEGGATTVVVADAERHRGRIDVTNIVPEVGLRGEEMSLDGAMHRDLVTCGFKPDVRYGIVNFRQSGHSGVGNAPALDTGEEGFAQLLQAVVDRGLVPVPMGEFTPRDWNPSAANLINYWTWPSVLNLGRQAEARLLRVMCKRFDVRLAVGMRSGVTDLLNYVGIPTLVIDIHPGRGDVAKGWERTLKRQDRGGRGLVGYELVSLLHERADERRTEGAWLGALHSDDLWAISTSLDLILHRRHADVQTPTEGFDVIADRANKIRARAEGLVQSLWRETERLERQGAEDRRDAPEARGTGKSKRSALEEIREEIEAQREPERLMAQLRQDADLIESLIAWIAAPSTPRSRRLDDAWRDLDHARALIRRYS